MLTAFHQSAFKLYLYRVPRGRCSKMFVVYNYLLNIYNQQKSH